MTPERSDALINDDLLEFEGHNHIRSLCHLVVFHVADSALICVVGNFDPPVGASTANAIPTLATAVADRVGRDHFRLFEWYPHRPGAPFSEVTLTNVKPQQIPYGQMLIADTPDADTGQHLVTVRFADPRFTPRTEDQLAKLLGEPAIRELRSYAGIPGDYNPQRLFGTTGHQKLDEINAHNRQITERVEAQISEWDIGSKGR